MIEYCLKTYMRMNRYKFIVLLLVGLWINSSYSQEQTHNQRPEYIPEKMEVILFSEYQYTYIYDTIGENKQIIHALKPPADSADAMWWNLTVYENIDNMLKVEVWRIEEALLENGYYGLMDITYFTGWIYKDNLAVYTHVHYGEYVELYDSINATKAALSFSCREWWNENTGILRVVDVDLESKWVKILWLDNKEYWLRPKNQCTNHITGCTGN